MSSRECSIEKLVVPHSSFSKAEKKIAQCYEYALRKGEAEGLAVVGESGTGKTSVLKQFYAEHPSRRGRDGMEVPILFASVPSNPTVKSLVGVMLEALGAPEPDRGTENEKTRQLRVLMKETGTRMVMIDEFQHFYDRGTNRIMDGVTNWLKRLIDQTNATIVVAGLPSCRDVISQNEQLRRRFMAHVELKRFNWALSEDRMEFRRILGAFAGSMSTQFDLPLLENREMAFRIYVATGGLISYVSRLLRQAVRNAETAESRVITMEDLGLAHADSIFEGPRDVSLPRPFDPEVKIEPTVELLKMASNVGVAADPIPRVLAHRRRVGTGPSVNSLLVAS